MEHKYSKRNNSECIEIKGKPMYKCKCGKQYQTRAQAEKHCRKMRS